MTPLSRPLSLLLALSGAGCCLAISSPAADAAPIIEWECNGQPSSAPNALTDTRLAEWEQQVRNGGGLLIALGRNPRTDAFRLARLAPTTAWHTLIPSASRGEALPPASSDPASGDPLLFPQTLPAIHLPWRWDIRPIHAVERGIARYERFAQKAPYTGEKLPAGHTLWTRPLENRDWRIRLLISSSDDPYQSPLLLTGRFGAGRVAVWASSLDSLKSSSPTYNAVRQWLGSASPATTPATAASQTLELTEKAVGDPEKRVLKFTLRNPNVSPIRGEIVARFLTWEGALVGDALAGLDLPAGASRSFALPFPDGAQDSVTGYAALNERDEWIVRLGVVGEHGRLIFPEQRITADLRPPVRVDLAVDSLRTLNNENYPYASIGPDTLFYRSRMGAQTSRYAYRPGETVTVTATLQHSLANIALQATPRDETSPGNASVSGLNDGAIQSEKTTRADVLAWSAWTGVPKQENRVVLELPHAREIRAVALHLQPTSYRNLDDFNPSTVRIGIDGRELTRVENLDTRSSDSNGRVLVSLPPSSQGREIRFIFPWDSPRTPRNRERRAPSVGEIELIALDESARDVAANGELIIRARETLSGLSHELGRTALTLSPGEQHSLSTTLKLPEDDESQGEQFWQIEALWSGQTVRTLPVLATHGRGALTSIEKLRPANAVQIGFIVTRGFRNVFDTGTGTREMPGGWGTPDDLVWAYSRKLKQTGPKVRASAGALYVNDSDFRHYSTPWISFPDGENFYELAIPRLLERAKADRRWAEADRVILEQSDRWDTGPAMEGMFTWTNFMEFDAHLRAQGRSGLTGRTRTQIASEILSRYDHQWQSWHLDRYLSVLRQLRATFSAEGKGIYIAAQGVPLVPPRAEAEVGAVIQGMSDDSTWGIEQENLPYTTGRQLGLLAINPSYRMSTLLQWGWNSAVINNPLWFSPVGTTEPSRRHYYHRAWRGVFDPIDGYRAMHAFGFNQNGYASWTMTAHDWQEWWRLHERHTLLTPEAPLGPGLVRSTAQFDAPETALFGGGGMGGDAAQREVRRTAILFQRLHEAGLAPAFAANAAQIDRWPVRTGMVIVNPTEFSTSEAAALARWIRSGGQAVAFHNPAAGPLPPAMASLFPRDNPASGRTLLVPVAAEEVSTRDIASRLTPLRTTLAPPLEFPAGTLGYGFRRGPLGFAVLEDWAETARTTELRIHGIDTNSTIRAVALNDHRSLAARRDADGVWTISVPLRPGDGEVVIWREIPKR